MIDLQAGELIDALAAHDVVFLVAGSVAAAAHGVTGIEPADLDIVPATDRTNLESLQTSLTDLRAQTGADLGEWRQRESGEFEWIQDGIRRPIQPLDPQRAASFDHFFRTPTASSMSFRSLPATTRISASGRCRPRWTAARRGSSILST